jgi:hypothetical protein
MRIKLLLVCRYDENGCFAPTIQIWSVIAICTVHHEDSILKLTSIAERLE